MLKPPMPNVAGMTDTLEFVKNLWGSMNIPGMTGAPGLTGHTLSTDELDKKIADLKAVESWLNLNIGMLRGTIQALEVQRGTIAALKSMGESMAQAMGQGGPGGSTTPFPFFTQAAPAPQSGAPGPSAPPPPPPQAPQPQQQPPQQEGEPAAAPGAAMPAAVAWWNLLQEQFRQAVASAMPPDGGAAGTDGKGGASPLDVSGGAPESGKPGGAAADTAPKGNPAPGRGTRSARSKADKA